MVEPRPRLYPLLCHARRFRSGIAIEGRAIDPRSARPPTRTDDFMGIRFPRDAIRPRTFWSTPAGESRHRQIETAPEEVYGATLAQKQRAKLLEHRVARSNDLPEAPRRIGIIGPVKSIFRERNRIRHFDRSGVDGNL